VILKEKVKQFMLGFMPMSIHLSVIFEIREMTGKSSAVGQNTVGHHNSTNRGNENKLMRIFLKNKMD